MKNYIFLATYSLHTSPKSGIFFKKKIQEKNRYRSVLFFFSFCSFQGDLEKGPVYLRPNHRRDPTRAGENTHATDRRKYPLQKYQKKPSARLSRKHQKKPTTPATNKKDQKN
jgi:hypothetical protein